MAMLAQVACSRPHSPGPLRLKRKRKRITSSRWKARHGKRLRAISGCPRPLVCAVFVPANPLVHQLTATALDLAEDYGIVAWVEALLAPDDVFKGSENKSMTPPPKFIFTANDRMSLPPPSSRGSTPARARGRPRAGSPSKSEKAASPRKQRVTKTSKAEDAANTRAVSASLQDALTKSSTPAIDEEEDDDEGLVRVELNESTQVNGDVKTTTTNVKVNLPGGMAADIPPQEQTEEIIKEAKAVVEAARKLEGGSSKASRKRKADELDEGSEEEADGQLQPAKKARLAEQELKKERVKNRALFGVAFTLAVG